MSKEPSSIKDLVDDWEVRALLPTDEGRLYFNKLMALTEEFQDDNFVILPYWDDVLSVFDYNLELRK